MIKIERCWCDRCSLYWLVGIGQFVQGSGFERDEAERIAKALNAAEGYTGPVEEVVRQSFN